MTEQIKLLEQQIALQKMQYMQQNQHEDEIDLKELFLTIWRGKWTIILTTFIAGALAIIYALSLPNIYKSTVLLAPTAEQSSGGGISALASQFGGLASIAGINLGGGSVDNTTIALEILKGKSFVAEFAQQYKLKALIMATNGWNFKNNQLSYNSDIYNEKTKKWLREVKLPRTIVPSDIEFYEYFIKNNLSVSKDKETGLVSISIKHYSPYVAKDIVEKLVFAINKKIKLDDITQANKSIKYLNQALKDTNNADMEKIFYQLIEKQQQTKMLANVKEQYVFKTIDPAVVAEKKDSPKRALIVILAVMLGGMLGIMVVLVRHFMSNSKE